MGEKKIGIGSLYTQGRSLSFDATLERSGDRYPILATRHPSFRKKNSTTYLKFYCAFLRLQILILLSLSCKKGSDFEGSCFLQTQQLVPSKSAGQ